MTTSTTATPVQVTRITPEMDAYRAGWLACQAAAAGVCDERAALERERASRDMDADSCGRALSREAAGKFLAAAIRALSINTSGVTDA